MTLICKWCGKPYESAYTKKYGYHNHCYSQKIRSVIKVGK